MGLGRWLTVQSWRPSLIIRTHIFKKSQVLVVFIIPTQGLADGNNPEASTQSHSLPASQLMSSHQCKTLDQKTKVAGAWGTAPEVDLRSLRAHFSHRCSAYKHTHTYTWVMVLWLGLKPYKGCLRVSNMPGHRVQYFLISHQIWCLDLPDFCCS